MQHLMIDLETLSTAKNAVILSLAAGVFDPFGEGMGDSIHVGLDPDSQMDLGGDVSGGTILWHIERSGKKDFPRPALPVENVIRQLSVFYKRQECRRVWSNGATFDIPIVEFYFKRLGINPPWHYGDARDTRTAFEIAGWGESPTRSRATHDALEDVALQIDFVQKAYKLIQTHPFGKPKVTRREKE